MALSKTSLRLDLAAGKTRQVIENLLATSAADRDLNAEAVALSARFQNYFREKNAGRVEPRWLDMELNQINAAVLHLVDRLPEDSSPTDFNWKKWAAIIAGTVAFGAAIAEFSGYSLRDFLKKTEPAPLIAPAAEPEKPAEKSAESPQTPKHQTNINVKDKAKVGNIITGDSNAIHLKQDF